MSTVALLRNRKFSLQYFQALIFQNRKHACNWKLAPMSNSSSTCRGKRRGHVGLPQTVHSALSPAEGPSAPQQHLHTLFVSTLWPLPRAIQKHTAQKHSLAQQTLTLFSAHSRTRPQPPQNLFVNDFEILLSTSCGPTFLTFNPDLMPL